jgi:hypothetical protein
LGQSLGVKDRNKAPWRHAFHRLQLQDIALCGEGLSLGELRIEKTL